MTIYLQYLFGFVIALSTTVPGVGLSISPDDVISKKRADIFF